MVECGDSGGDVGGVVIRVSGGVNVGEDNSRR